MPSLLENEGLVHKLTYMVWQRLAPFASDMEYEDLYQEATEAYLKAESEFDEARGFKFSTYVSGVILNRLNFISDTAIQKRRHESNSSCLSDTFDLSHFPSQESWGKTEQRMIDVMSCLSPVAKVLFRETYMPSDRTILEFRRVEKLNKAKGKRRHGYFYLNIVSELIIKLGMDRSEVEKSRKELLSLGKNDAI